MGFGYKKEFYMSKDKPLIGLLYGIAFTIKMSRKSDHRIDGFCDEGRFRLGSRRSHQEKEK